MKFQEPFLGEQKRWASARRFCCNGDQSHKAKAIFQKEEEEERVYFEFILEEIPRKDSF